MKKFSIFAIIVILITLIVVPFTYSFGTATKKQIGIEPNTNEFFKVVDNEVSLNDKIQVIIDINKVEYNKFKIQIISDLNNVKIEENGINIQEQDNSIEIEIDKEQMTLKQITLTYELPENIQVGEKIFISSMVTNLENEEENKTINKEITIVEKKIEDDNIKNDFEVQENFEEIKKEDKQGEMNLKTTSEIISQVEENSKNISSIQSTVGSKVSFSKSSESVLTYNGSDNNYLSSIIVEGYELTKEFSKENENYFVKVSENDQNIDIEAIAEDSNAKVSIYGNEELKTGTDKVLINVTAENGNVRTYRIYVTK